MNEEIYDLIEAYIKLLIVFAPAFILKLFFMIMGS